MNKRTILLIDDEEDVLTFLGYNFTKLGFEVLKAMDGAEAFRIMKVFKPEIIICDILMPVMGGVEFCDKIKQDPQLKEIPLIFLSASTDDHIILNIMLAGNAVFLQKPIRFSVLSDMIERALRKDILLR